jgi:demethylmenaquinone methyltransferase/2-methoxy-6-polyprenyl-1,4-benzoquinol methylase
MGIQQIDRTMVKNGIWKSEDLERESYFGFQKVKEEEKARHVMHHFDTVAKRYDFMNSLLSFGIHHIWKRQAVKMLGLSRGDRVIDVCGGTGDLALLTAKAIGPNGRIVIYDINRAMLREGQRKLASSGAGDQISCVQGDAEAISFPDGTFDVAMVGFGIRNLTHMEEGFREMCRVLRPGGKLMCLEFSKPTSRIFRWLYDLYSFRIMPLLGWVIVGSRRAYTYLPESIRLFPLPDDLAALMKSIGFRHIVYLKMTNGIAVTHVAKKGKGR